MIGRDLHGLGVMQHDRPKGHPLAYLPVVQRTTVVTQRGVSVAPADSSPYFLTAYPHLACRFSLPQQ